MVKIDNVKVNSSVNIDCNSLSFKNNGAYEAQIDFAASGTRLTVSKGQVVYVFNSDTAIQDELSISFSNPYEPGNELEVIQTLYPASSTPTLEDNSTPLLTEEKVVYVNVAITDDSSPRMISTFAQGVAGVVNDLQGLSLVGGYSFGTPTVAALQTRTSGAVVESNLYGGWIDIQRALSPSSTVEFGLGFLSTVNPHLILSGIYFRIVSGPEAPGGVISIETMGDYFSSSLRSSWYDPLDGTGPSGINYDFVSGAKFYFEFVPSGGIANVYITYSGVTALVHKVIYNGVMFRNPRLHIFVRAEAPNVDSSFNINFVGCSIYRKGKDDRTSIKKCTGLSTLTMNLPNNLYGVGFYSSYLGMAFKKDLLGAGYGYRYYRLRDFEIHTGNDQPFTSYLMVNPTFFLGTPLFWEYPLGFNGSDERFQYARGTSGGSYQISNYDYMIDISQQSSRRIARLIEEALLNEIDGTPNIVAIAIVPGSNNSNFRVTANIEEI